MMAVNWAMQQFQPRTRLDLSPLNAFAQARRDKAQASLANLELTRAEKQAKADSAFKEIMMANTGPNGQQNRQAIMSQLYSNGLVTKANKLKQDWLTQDKNRFEMQKASYDFNTKKMNNLIKTYANLPELTDGKTDRIDYYHDKIQPFTKGPDWSDQIDNEIIASSKSLASPTQTRTRQMSTKAGIVNFLPDGTTEFARDPETGEKLFAPENVTKLDLGDKVMVLDKAGKHIQTYKKGIEEEKTPEYKARVAGAVQQATGKEKPIDVKQRSKKAISATVEDMRQFYKELNDLGGIVNIENGTLSNIKARISSSSLGQAVQKALGTKAQSIRNSIIAMQPELLGAIRKASDMGAKGMDSEKELQFYLRAATDPKDDLQFNLVALEKLDRAYGLGLGLAPAPPQIPLSIEDAETESMKGF